ncbi:ATP-grasp domain-containing protein [Streptomyces sp. APSN-46.1]|uniref:ATP-grasp domain-containing protein n=1 Tax=Streptomyces sp. APSN-46.1 TaxID=2929049 RepID=UPI001FB4AF0C|nr:ATP-grasp domain-containing protein [Streptomyces sp. APSN-46.1]MCJ1678227.1 ATP-grasp domain-containing protein [Streptomyces sp. APSN-46.1]
MNPERTLLLVGATDETLIKAKALGLHVLLLQHPTKITPEQESLVDLVRVVDFTRWDLVEPIARELHEAPGFAAALSLTEPGLEGAASINDLFGLGGTGHEVALRFRDKGVMRRHFAALDPDAVRSAPLRDREDLDAFGSRHGYPFIVKPTDATASIGVRRVDGPSDIEGVWDEVRRLSGTRTDRVSTLFILRDFLMEEYLDGPEYSVESFSFAGRHVVAAITEKFTDPAHCAELGHAVPARLPSGAEEQVRESVARFLDQIGYRDGVSHTEIRIGKEGPKVIESHNRVAGDAIPELVRSAYGIDMMTLALGWPFRLVEELPDRPVAHAGASVRVLVGEPGTVESVEGVAEALRQEGVIDVRISAKPGDAVRPVRDNWDRLGLVAVAGPDTTAAVRRGAEVIRDSIRVRVLGADGRAGLADVAQVTEHTVESA